jgi:hypothetical protein
MVDTMRWWMNLQSTVCKHFWSNMIMRSLNSKLGFLIRTSLKKTLLMARETLFDLVLLQNCIGVRIVHIFAQ